MEHDKVLSNTCEGKSQNIKAESYAHMRKVEKVIILEMQGNG